MSIADEVKKLEELHAEGALTDEEFDSAKQRVLNGESSGHGDGRIFGIGSNTWCLLMHLSQLLTYSAAGIVVPIVMWLLSKDESREARIHGANMMNWLLSCIIYMVVSGLLCFVVIGIPFFIMFACLSVIFPIVAAIKAHNREYWQYPMAIQFFRTD